MGASALVLSPRCLGGSCAMVDARSISQKVARVLASPGNGESWCRIVIFGLPWLHPLSFLTICRLHPLVIVRKRNCRRTQG